MEPAEAAVAAAAGTRRVGCSSDGPSEEDSASMLLLHCASLIPQLALPASHWPRRGHVTPAWTDRGTDGMNAMKKRFSSASLLLLAANLNVH